MRLPAIAWRPFLLGASVEWVDVAKRAERVRGWQIIQVPLPQGRFLPHGPQYLTGAPGVDKFLRAAPLAAVPGLRAGI